MLAEYDLLIAINKLWTEGGSLVFDEIDGALGKRSPNRAQRRTEAQRVARNRRKLAMAKGHSYVVERSDNELAERHPFDCGRRCLMCHGEKILGSGSRRQREKREALTLEDAAYDERVRVRFQRHA